MSTGPLDLYKRWVAFFGLLSSHSRAPWQQVNTGHHGYKDEESVEVVRYFTRLKCSLMPYIYAHAVEASKKRDASDVHDVLEFHDDPVSDYLDRQYILGDSLLVAPVFNEDGRVSYYLPDSEMDKFHNRPGPSKVAAGLSGKTRLPEPAPDGPSQFYYPCRS